MNEAMSETDRRDLAFSNRNQVTDDVGEKLAPTNLSQMISLRLDGDLVTALRQHAESRGTTVSELLREAAARLLTSEQTPTNRPVVSYRVRIGREQSTSSDEYRDSGDQLGTESFDLM